MKRYLRIASLILVVIIVLSGCSSVRGGGWLPHTGYFYEYDTQELVTLDRPTEYTELSEKKSTFGFTCKVYDVVYDEYGYVESYDVKGNLTYIDHEKGIKISGEIVDGGGDDLFGIFQAEGTLNGRECTINVEAADWGEPGENDTFYIEAYGTGFYYYNYGTVGGGNIQIQEAKEAK